MIIYNDLQVYQRSNNFIWTDNYISKNMLKAHLDINNDAASRNINTIRKTIQWIKSKIPKNSNILDLGCGPGLYSSLLSKEGHTVTGIDISERSISYAKQKAQEDNLQIDYFCRDYLSDEIGRGYDVVICIYCDFGALIPDEQEVLLNKIHNGLNKDGIFIFDVFKPDICKNKEEKRDWHYLNGGDFWCDSPYLKLEEMKHFIEEKVWGTRTIIIEKNKKSREYITWDNYYSSNEIKEVLKKSDFEVISVNEELIEKNNFTNDEVMFIEARK